MVQFRAANLRDVVSRPAVTGKPIYASVENAFRFDTKKRIEQLNDFFQAKASNQAGSTAPTLSVRGELWADTSTAGAVTLYVDPDGEGYDDNVARRLTAKNISFKTGGTATFKLGGAINVNTTQTSPSGGTLMSFSMPGNTLSSDGDIAAVVGFGTQSGILNDQVGFLFGTLASRVADIEATGSIAWYFKAFIARTGGAESKVFAMIRNNQDVSADTQHVGNATSTDALNSDQIIRASVSGTGGNPKQELMITRYLP